MIDLSWVEEVHVVSEKIGDVYLRLSLPVPWSAGKLTTREATADVLVNAPLGTSVLVPLLGRPPFKSCKWLQALLYGEYISVYSARVLPSSIFKLVAE